MHSPLGSSTLAVMRQKPGRKKTGNRVRETEVSFALTPEDAQWFTEVAHDLGFTSRGQLFTAIMERLAIGQLAPFVFLKVGYQLAQRAQETGASKGAGFWNPFRDSIPPLEPAELPRPPLPLPDAELAASDKKQLRAHLKAELA